MVGFKFLDTSPTQRQSLMMDSTPVHSGYNNSHCGERPVAPRNCRYPIPRLKESFEPQLSVYF